MKKHICVCQTDANNSPNNNEEINPKSLFKFFNINNNYLVSPNNRNVKNINIKKNNNKNINNININSLCQNKSLPNYSLENNLSNYHKSIFSNKNSFSQNKIDDIDNNSIMNKSPNNKYIYNKIEKDIRMIKIQLASDILKNKIQLLHNLGNDNKKYNNYINDNCYNSQNIKRKNNNNINKRNIVLNNININNNKNILNNNNNIPNNNSLKNIYYINNNFRINSIQNNENRSFNIPKSAFINNSPNYYIQRQKKQNNNINNINNIINIPINKTKTVSNSPNYYISNSSFNENIFNNNTIYKYNNYNTPKSHLNILINKKRIKNNNVLPQGFFDDYLLNESNLKKKNNIIIKRNNNINNNNINNINNHTSNTYKNEMQSKNVLKIEKYNNFFIGCSKEKKQPQFQTENKIINFSYISASNTKSKNLLKNNKVINTINFSLNPVKINFEKKENITPNEKENKTLTELINPNDLEEKSVILENSSNNSKDETKPKKNLIFGDDKIVIKYNQNDYLRNYDSICKINIKENKSDKINHKFISTTKLCNLLKKKNKNIKSNLIKKDEIKFNPNLALMKLNELIDDEPKSNIRKKNKENNKPKYIQKNINFIKKLEECNKKGINCRSLTLSKNEIKLLNKNKKNLKNNTQQNMSKEKINDDDNIFDELKKINEDDKNKNKLNNSFS